LPHGIGYYNFVFRGLGLKEGYIDGVLGRIHRLIGTGIVILLQILHRFIATIPSQAIHRNTLQPGIIRAFGFQLKIFTNTYPELTIVQSLGTGQYSLELALHLVTAERFHIQQGGFIHLHRIDIGIL
tara:strand:- start:39223 stop:39603 length:381 start_codon:yes stop_codon:yes gene_type:complete